MRHSRSVAIRIRNRERDSAAVELQDRERGCR